MPLLERAFYFVRHGETEHNVRGLVAGSTDVLLTECGQAQARAAARALAPVGITAIYSSALRRARDTADCIGRSLALPVTVVEALGERNWGELEGQPRELRVRGAIPHGAEPPHQFMQRIVRGLATIDAGGVPLVVAHSGVYRVLCRVLGVIEPEAPVANAQPVRFVPPAHGAAVWTVETLALPLE
jgi:probable phosphoglycerate mutase